jgi:predicted transcriptional regulator
MQDKAIELYVNQQKNLKEAAQLLGVSKSALYRYLKKVGVVRSIKEGRVLAAQLGKGCVNLSREQLEDLHIKHKMSGATIGKQLGISGVCVNKYLRRFGLSRSKSDIAAEAKKGWRIYDYSQLEKLYVEDGLIPSQIEKITGIPRNAIRKYLRKEGLIRSRLEGIARGSQHPSFKGRVVNGGYVYIWNPQHPRARRNRVPEHILVWEKEHGQFLPDGWMVHHLNDIKSDNRSENLRGMPKGKHHAYLLIQALQQRIRELEGKPLVILTTEQDYSFPLPRKGDQL